MSSVSSTESGGIPAYYQKYIRDLTNQVEEEKKKDREANQKEIDTLSENYKSSLRKQESDSDRTVQKHQENANEQIARQSDKYRTDLQDLEEKYRTQFLAQQQNKGYVYPRPPGEITKEIKEDYNRVRESQDQYLHNLESHYKENLAQKEAEATEALREASRTSSEAIYNQKKVHDAEIERLNKNKTYNSKGVVQVTVPYDIHKKMIEDLEKAREIQEADAKKSLDARVDKFTNTMKEKEEQKENQIASLLQDQDEQVHQLKEQTSALTDHFNEANKERIERTTTQMLQNDQDKKAERERLLAIYDTIQSKLRNEMRSQEDRTSQKNAEILEKRERSFANAISNQALEHASDRKTLQKVLGDQILQEQENRKKEVQKVTDYAEKRQEQLNQGHEVTLQKQAEEFSHAFATQRKNDQSELDRVKSELLTQQTTSDPSKISPGAETVLRREIATDYQKKFDFEVQRNKLNTDKMQERFNQQHSEIIQESADRETQFHKDSEKEKFIERSQYLDMIQDAEFHAHENLRHKDAENQLTVERLIQKYNNIVQKQRRDYEKILTNYEATLGTKIAALRHENEALTKNAARTSNAKQNELIREYERKLTELKEEYTGIITDQRNELQATIRDTERRSRQELEMVIKNYEERISQLAQQNQEHERYIVQTYQDELERTRRSYETLNKKKS